MSTVYLWARSGIVEPSVSPTRIKLWSYADLMALRIVHWLRHPKEGRRSEIAASPMPRVREALAELERRGLDILGRLWGAARLAVASAAVGGSGLGQAPLEIAVAYRIGRRLVEAAVAYHEQQRTLAA